MISATGKKGLTFIELLVVIIILGILSGVAVPRINNTFNNLQLENASKSLFSLVKYTQSQAVDLNKIYCFRISPDQRNLEFLYQDSGKWYLLKNRIFKFSLPDGVILVTQPENKNEVYFYPDGGIDEIKLILKDKKNKQISLSIKGILGEVSIE